MATDVMPKRLDLDEEKFPKLTHYLFRYPAKFHPPVVRNLLEMYTSPGETVLDPFCGSGTLLIEAAVSGRQAIGSDVDPLAVFVSQQKTVIHEVAILQRSWSILDRHLSERERSMDEYRRLMFEDVPEDCFKDTIATEALWVPQIPNLHHWFRRAVLLDLARILREIDCLDVSDQVKGFFLLCFASIIRGASNADPVPVSGLEVTAHMRRRDAAGRLINPFALYRRAVAKGIDAVATYVDRVKVPVLGVLHSDATELPADRLPVVHAVITSPPYHNAVDYYRRHQLEMYWLGLTKTHEERLKLASQYIGRAKVKQSHPLLSRPMAWGTLTKSVYEEMLTVNPRRATDFKHYVLAMTVSLQRVSEVLPEGSPVVMVVGQSKWDGRPLDTGLILSELSANVLELVDQYWYPTKNRYMSYRRHNGASIGEETVLVFRRMASRAT